MSTTFEVYSPTIDIPTFNEALSLSNEYLLDFLLKYDIDNKYIIDVVIKKNKSHKNVAFNKAN